MIDRNAPIIPEPQLQRHLGVSKETLRGTGIAPAEETPTGRWLHSIASAERVAERLVQQRKTA